MTLAEQWYQQAFSQPYDGNHQQLYFIPHLIQNVERDVLCDGYRLLEIRHSGLKSFSRSKWPSVWWLHTFLPLQCCWKDWFPHATACVQGTYVVCSRKGIQWSWGTYLLGGEIKRLVVEWTGTVVEFRNSYNNFDCFNSYDGRWELRKSLHLSVQTRHILLTITVTRRNGQYTWVSETSTCRLDRRLRILQPCLFPLFPLLRNSTLLEMETQLLWRNYKSTMERF